MEINKIIVFITLISFIILFLLQIKNFWYSIQHYSCGPGPSIKYRKKSLFFSILKDIVFGIFLFAFSHAITPIDIYFMTTIIVVPFIIDTISIIKNLDFI